MKTTYPYQKPISENNLVEAIESGSKFGVVVCSIEVPERLRAKLSKFYPIFKNCEISLEDIGPRIKDSAHEHNLLKETRKMLISSFYLQQAPVFTPALQFYLGKGLVLNQVYWYIQLKRKMFRVLCQLHRGSAMKRRQKHIFNCCWNN